MRGIQSPIVLINKNPDNNTIASNVAPNISTLGVMLPYTPLHHLLMREIGSPVVCTSGNLSEEPIVVDEYEALERLEDIADYYLVHNRPVARPVDDSVVRIIGGKETVIRSARGYAPVEFDLEDEIDGSYLAVGPVMKNSIAVKVGNKCVMSQHIGDIESRQTYDTFIKTIDSMCRLYQVVPEMTMADKHPDYVSTVHARTMGKPVILIQHHQAHLFACILENNLKQPVLGVVWDGTGLGNDGTIWGGEFILVENDRVRRIGRLRQFRLPGGDKAVREPRRSAISILYEMYGNDILSLTGNHTVQSFEKAEMHNIFRMLEQDVMCPFTSSMGRLFDTAASLLGFCQISDYDAEAAMSLESAIAGITTDQYYDFIIELNDEINIVDWQPMIEQIIMDIRNDIDKGVIAAKFHNTTVEMITEMAKRVGVPQIALTGGCFQNKYLTERAFGRLSAENFKPYRHCQIPTNDGGVSAGQIMAGHFYNRGK